MKTSRNIGGSLLPSNDSRILSPVPFRNGSLQVRPDAEHDTHALWFVAAGQETKLAQHPNGYSCRSLAERILSGDSVRVMDQADYIVACGGTADVEAIKALVGAPDPRDALIARAYTLLADIRHDWPGRVSAPGQSLLCDLREAVAKAQGSTGEEVSSGVRCDFMRAALDR